MNTLRGDIDRFDTDMVQRADIFSDKWVQLFKNSTPNDEEQLSSIMKTTAIGGHNMNRFDLQNHLEKHSNSHPDSIIEQNQLILLAKKFFEFETTTDTDVAISGDRNARDNIEKYTTVFYQSDDPIENDFNSSELPACAQVKPTIADSNVQEKTHIKANKKKKGRTKYRPLTCDDVSTTQPNARTSTMVAAPPGAKALKSPISNPSMDLSKNGNHSLQFRL